MRQKKISILVDAHLFDKEPQGTRTYIIGLYTAFIQLYKDDYNIYFTANNTKEIAQCFPMLENDKIIKLKKTGTFKRLFFEMPKIIKDYKIDYAHFQQISPLFKTCNYIVTVHDVLFNEYKDMFSPFYRLSRNFLFKRALSLSDIRLTVSDYSKAAISHAFKINNIHVTYNAIKSEYTENFDKAVSEEYVFNKFKIKNYILYVSRIEKRKNHLLLLQAYRKLKLHEKDISLVFVGKNDIPVKALEEEISNLSTEEKEKFCWLEKINDEDLIEIYRAAYLFIYPSLAEGFGIPPIEAGALTINTLCSNLTAMADFDFFEDNQFDPNNFNEFIDKLNRNIIAPPDVEKLQAISEVIKLKYSWFTGAKLVHELIQDHNSNNKNNENSNNWN